MGYSLMGLQRWVEMLRDCHGEIGWFRKPAASAMDVHTNSQTVH